MDKDMHRGKMTGESQRGDFKQGKSGRQPCLQLVNVTAPPRNSS